LLIGSIFINYTWGRILSTNRSKVYLTIGVIFNLTLLGWFKYAGFLTSTVNDLSGTQFNLGNIVLPLGISFFTFQQIAYLVDTQRGIAYENHFGRYCLFVAFFPQLIAGPIVHHGEILPQYAQSEKIRLRLENIVVGISIFTIGLFKKVILADPMGEYADRVFSAAAHGDPVTFVTAWAANFAVALEIYFDFSGYSDMAIGLARIFGIKLPLNFNSPYKAKNIIDFWRRWHMTLSRFLRDYLYVPLGGNRLGRVRRYINLAIVMLLGGLWHGAAWNFVIWGGLHGLYLIINHGWRRLYPLISWPQGNFKGITTFAAQTATLLAVIFAWTFFRSENWLSAQTMMMALTGQTGIFLPSSYEVSFSYVVPFLSYFGVQFGAGPDPAIYPTLSTFIQIIGLFCFVLIVPNTQQWLAQYQPALNTAAENIKHIRESFLWRPNAFTGACFAILFLVCLGYLLKNNHHEFIYFQF